MIFLLDFQWYLFVGWLDLLGKLRVSMMILPGKLVDSLEDIGASSPHLVQAWVKSDPRMIMTPALF